MRKEKIVLVGGGGHAKVVIDTILSSGIYDIAGITDPELSTDTIVLGVPVIGDDVVLSGLMEQGVKNAFISIGSIGDCEVRKKLFNTVKGMGFNIPYLVHASATVAKDVLIDEGAFIAPSVTVNPGTVIGKNAILNTASSVDHDCRIGDFVHIAPKVVLSGGVEIGDGTHIGIGAIVIQYKKIGKRCFIKSKELVNSDVPDGDVFPRGKTDVLSRKRNRIFIIAEAGINHNGSLETAKKMADAALIAGADAVKFQSFKAENIVTRKTPKAEYQRSNTDPKESQFGMLVKLELSDDDQKGLKAYCDMKGIMFLSSPFDLESIDMLDDLGMEIFKIPSGEITNLPYLRKIGKLSKKVILSTGMATLQEVSEAIGVLESAGTGLNNITVLQCTTQYPAPFEDVNLNVMTTLRDNLRTSVGYSDHTLGIEVSIAAAALGAEVIEKHFTLDREMEGPDHKASLEPYELKNMIRAIRNIEKALGENDEKIPSLSELKNRDVVRKSLVASRGIKKGELLTEENITAKRPGTAISPMMMDMVIGKRARKDFLPDEVIEI